MENLSIFKISSTLFHCNKQLYLLNKDGLCTKVLIIFENVIYLKTSVPNVQNPNLSLCKNFLIFFAAY